MNMMTKITAQEPVSDSLGTSDPIFAAIESHRNLRANVFQAMRDLEETQDSWRPTHPGKRWWSWSVSERKPPRGTDAINAKAELAFQRADAALDRAALNLLKIRPTTEAGIVALLRYSASEEVRNGYTFWPETIPGLRIKNPEMGLPAWHIAIERHAAASLERLSFQEPTPPPNDSKVFDAIERHRAAEVACRNDKTPDDIPEYLMKCESVARKALLKTVPETAEGLLALSQYVAHENYISLEGDGDLDLLLLTVENAAKHLTRRWQRLTVLVLEGSPPSAKEKSTV